MQGVQLEQNRAFGGVIDILEAMGIDYVIWGGVAAALYGEPRFTQDMDVVVRLDYRHVARLAQMLEEDGYYTSVEAMREALDRDPYFNVIHLETGIKVDFHVAGRDPILDWAFEHRRVELFDEFRHAAYMPPESVILTKLRAYKDSGSERHWRDVEGILRLSGAGLDIAYIDREAARIGVFGTWRELLDRARGV